MTGSGYWGFLTSAVEEEELFASAYMRYSTDYCTPGEVGEAFSGRSGTLVDAEARIDFFASGTVVLDLYMNSTLLQRFSIPPGGFVEYDLLGDIPFSSTDVFYVVHVDPSDAGPPITVLIGYVP